MNPIITIVIAIGLFVAVSILLRKGMIDDEGKIIIKKQEEK